MIYWRVQVVRQRQVPSVPFEKGHHDVDLLPLVHKSFLLDQFVPFPFGREVEEVRAFQVVVEVVQIALHKIAAVVVVAPNQLTRLDPVALVWQVFPLCSSSAQGSNDHLV